MNYIKPEATLLGSAIALIESLPPSAKTSSNNEANFPTPNTIPAYDLDE